MSTPLYNPQLRWMAAHYPTYEKDDSPMYYCFNTDCNLWGEPQSVLVLAYWPQQGVIENGCRGCGGNLIIHDNWTRDQRRHDDGSPVKES